MATFHTSSAVTADLNTEKKSPNWNLTTDDVAAKLHDEMVGKTVVITGVSKDGLGAEAARVIAKHDPKLLILASRSASNIEEVIKQIKNEATPGVAIKPLEVDLASQESVRKAAAEILEMTPVVDVLINNAAVMMIPTYQTTKDGIEMHFGVYHIGHFLLTNLLMPALLRVPSGPRVVNISSHSTHGSPVRFDDVNFGDGKNYELYLAYAASKNANTLFSRALALKLGCKGLCSFTIDPGSVATTRLSREIPKEDLVGRGWFLENGDPNPTLPFKSVAQGAAGYLMAAYDPDLKGDNGTMITACAIDNSVSEASRSPENVDKLWKLSEELVKQKFTY